MPASRFQPSFAAGVLGPGLHGRIDTAKYDVGLKAGTNVFVHVHGGVSNRAGTEFIAEVWDHSKEYRLIPFARDEDDNYVMVMGDQEMRIIFEGAWVESAGSPYTPSTPFAHTDLQGLDWAQSVDVMYLTHLSYAPQVMSRSGLTSWTFANLSVDPTLTAPASVTATPNAAGAETYKYVVSPVTDGVEGFPSAEATAASAQDLVVSGAFNTISWTGSADEYNIYRERNGVFGYIGFTSDTSFVDDNISADLTVTPVQAAGLFGSSGNYPSQVSLYQQRLVLASSTNDVETIWFSRAGDFTNFTRSRILRDDDRIELSLTGTQINRVKGMVPLRELLVFSATGEFSVTGPSGVMSAINPIQTQYGYAGSNGVRPLVVDDTALFVNRTGREVRDLRYAFEQDGYSGNDLTIFASHFFEGKQVKAWGFAQSPFSVVWTVLDDGTLLSLTYKREHQVWAWTEHDVGGDVEDVAVIREGSEDAVYLLIKRTINGATVRYVERIHQRRFADISDAFFVDCGITYEGAATTTITGLSHLEGETVSVLADGSVIANRVVSSGQITIAIAASKVHVGLPYTAEIETLPPSIILQDLGAARGRPHTIPKVRVQLERSRGIEAADVDGDWEPLTRTGADLSEQFPEITGMVDIVVGGGWNTDGTVRIRQRYPLPMTVLGVSPEIVIGRSS